MIGQTIYLKKEDIKERVRDGAGYIGENIRGGAN